MAKIPEHFKPTRKLQLKEMMKRLTTKLEFITKTITTFKPYSKGPGTAEKVRKERVKMARRSLDATRSKIYRIKQELQSL